MARKDPGPIPQVRRVSVPGAKGAKHPGFVKPQLATLWTHPPQSDRYLLTNGDGLGFYPKVRGTVRFGDKSSHPVALAFSSRRPLHPTSPHAVHCIQHHRNNGYCTQYSISLVRRVSSSRTRSDWDCSASWTAQIFGDVVYPQ